MKPFLIFRAPEKVRWLKRPTGKNRYRIYAWVELPISKQKLIQDIRVKEPATLTDLKPLIDNAVDELMDELRNELFHHWATFLLSVNDSTTNEEIDTFHDAFLKTDYGFECYLWG